jgi:hypothetical protein
MLNKIVVNCLAVSLLFCLGYAIYDIVMRHEWTSPDMLTLSLALMVTINLVKKENG